MTFGSFPQDLATYTRQAPPKRLENLRKFAARLKNSPKVMEILSDWDLEFVPELCKLKGREYPPEAVEFGGGKIVKYNIDKCEWARGFK